MKLIFCTKCHDIVKLPSSCLLRYCLCGHAYGRYVDGLYAEYGGSATPLGIANGSFARAFKDVKGATGEGIRFEAFFIPDDCPTFKDGG